MPDAFWVRVPASTSNLGPGFDVLGMALDVFLEAEFRPGGSDLELRLQGTLTPFGSDPASDLFHDALCHAMGVASLTDDAPDGDLPRGILTVDSSIPIGRGLGSSAAALVAGRVAGHLLSGRDPDPPELVSWVTAREGHPDNAAPAVLGGLVAASIDGRGRVRTAELPLSPGLGWVFAAPHLPLPTRASRGVLPDQVPRDVAVRTAGRMALLLPALASGDGPALAHAMADELHVPFRLPLIPGATTAVQAGLDAGAWAVTLSGAGSGLLAVTPDGAREEVGAAMARAFQEAPGTGGGFFRVVRPWRDGTGWGAGEPRGRGGNEYE